jgi:hypothetical protein
MVKRPVPQRSQGQNETRPAPVGELAGDGDVARPWVVVEKMDGTPVEQRCAYGAEQAQEMLQCVLQARLCDLLRCCFQAGKLTVA